MNNYKQLTINGLKLEYLSFGNGPKTLVCFHGFGREAQDFKEFEIVLGKHTTIYSVNLFYHGESKFPDSRLENKPLEKAELKSLFELLQKTEKFTTFSLAGYSLGGKVALTLTELFPNETESLYLMAPDGIKANPWYYFASQTLVGQKLNRLSIKHQWIFHSFMKLSSGLGLASKRQRRFANSQMKSLQQRNLVYKIWMAHRKLIPNLNRLSRLIKDNKINTHFYIGRHDKIIPIKPIEKFSSSLGDYGTLTFLNCGHKMDFEELGKLISKAQ